MIKIIQELNILRKCLRQYASQGASIEDIEAESALSLPRRTLLRRLTRLKQLGELYTRGKTRNTRYFLLVEPTDSLVEDSPPENTMPPLSQSAQSVLTQISKPLSQRKRAKYNPKFLTSYVPNKTHYLSPQEREKLASIGKTMMPNEAAGSYAKEILNRLLIDLSWNSSRLEGNTYSLLDTKRLIEHGESADEKSTLEAQMILNHKDAIEFLVYSAKDIGFNRYTILNLHAILSNNLLGDRNSPGRLRSIAVGIHQSAYDPLSIPQQISEYFDLVLAKTNKIKDPFEQAFFIMVHLSYLQAFEDVNKRTSRLAANIPFIVHNLSPLSFVDMPEDLYIQGIMGVYEFNKIDLLKAVFLWAYQRSAVRYATLRQTVGEPDLFYVKYRDPIRQLITHVITQNMDTKKAAEKIKLDAKRLPAQVQNQFIEAVETELLSLHEGNFARYRVSPAQFARWQKKWRT